MPNNMFELKTEFTKENKATDGAVAQVDTYQIHALAASSYQTFLQLFSVTALYPGWQQ